MHIKEIENRNVWEQFISLYAPQSLFQSWDWGETITKCTLQNATHIQPVSNSKKMWRIGVYEDSFLLGIAQIVKVGARRGTFLHVRHGPIFSVWNEQNFSFFHSYMESLCKEERAHFIRVSPLVENNEHNKDLLCHSGYRGAPIHAMDGEYCWILDISPNEDDLLSGMRKTTRYLIRQAQKMDISITKSKNPDDLDEFFFLYEKTAKRHHFVKHIGIKEEFAQFSKTDNILLFKGYFENQLVSAALIIFYNNQAIYHHSASIPMKVPVNYLLQWEAIREAKRRGKTLYNFWGIAPVGKTRHPWKGHSLFKIGFGGKIVEYMHAQDAFISKRYWFTYGIELLRRIVRGY